MMWARCGAVAGVLLLAACTTEPGGIFRVFDINDKHQSVTTGARQRAILTRRPQLASRPGLVNPDSIVCAEPSPDVGMALATSFGTGISLLGQGSGSLSAQTSEGLLELAERTASIQLMRDQMYRACEAYANGAITGTTYSLLMSRITETMVTLLLGETAGGAFGRSLGALGGKASASAEATMAGFAGALEDISQATDALAAAETDFRTADASYVKLKEEKGEDDDEVKAAKAERDAAEARRDVLKEQLQLKLDTSATAAGEIATVTAGGAITGKPDAATAAVLATMQNTYIDRDPGHALIEACLVELGMWNADAETTALFMETAETLMTKAKEEERETLGDDGARDLAYLALKTERTGLFEYCRTYLPQVANTVYATNATLDAQRLTLEQRAQEISGIEARARAASAMASALSQCERIADEPGKAACKAVVVEIRGQSLPAAAAGDRDVRLALRSGGSGHILPTLDFDRARAAYAVAKLRLAELANTAGPNDPPDGLAGEEKAKHQTQQKALQDRKADLERQAARARDEDTDTFEGTSADSARGALATIERQQIDLARRAQNEPDPRQRGIILNDLDSAHLRAQTEVERYRSLERKFNTLAAKMDLLISDLTAFNNR